MAGSEEVTRPQTSTRDPEAVRARLLAWLTRRLPGDARPAISLPRVPATNGMSSETLLFDAEWTEDGARREERCVVRMRPSMDAKPVFPTYDMDKQYRVMKLVAERCDVPVPVLLWNEPDEEPLGAPFFVMRRAEGAAPPDVMPYTIDGWLLDATPEQRAAVQDAAVDIIAGVHGIPVVPEETAFLHHGGGGDTALRRHLDDLRAFYEWGIEGQRVPLLDRAFAWLEEHLPADPGPDVISWGDSRIGNILYRDFRPTAVLDWEMAAVGPRELDLAWLVFTHAFFQDIAVRYGRPGIPGFLRGEDVCARYERITGHTPRNMPYFQTYAAVRHGVVMARIAHRQWHFGERARPDDLDETIPHRGLLEAMLDGAHRA